MPTAAPASQRLWPVGHAKQGRVRGALFDTTPDGLGSNATRVPNMSRMIICATVAFVCCGQQSFAQPGAYDHESQPRLQIADFPQDTVIPNPFDFSTESTSPSDRTPAVRKPQAELSDAVPDPGSLPVARQPHQRSIVDTMVDQSMLMNTPHADFEPVEWCPTMRGPNPVGEFMLRQFCVDGLWDGYEAQRAHLCLHQWHKLTGRGCQNCGTACGSAANCHGSGDCGSTVRNRYRTSRCGGDCGAHTATHCAQHTSAATTSEVVETREVEVAELDATSTGEEAGRDYFAELKASINR
jgi:hypothetical protein